MRAVATLAATIAAIDTAAAYFDGYMNVTDGSTPLQIRLAFSGDTGMIVSYNTFEYQSKPSVRYGRTKVLDREASSDISVTYPTSLTYNNHVNITGLEPDALYYYLPANSNSSEPYNFTTARPAGSKTPFTVAVVVDLGTFGALGLSDHVGKGAANPLTVNEQTTIQSIQKQLDSFDYLIHAGDIAYADYWLKEEIQGYLPNTTIANGYKVYEAILNAFYDELEPITTYKPYMVNGGNHEANCDNGGTTDKAHNISYTAAICSPGQTNFTGYRNHFRMPSGPSGGVENFWYSYNQGMAHFVHIDTETDLGHGLTGPDEGKPENSGPFGLLNQQIDWLAADLAAVDRDKTPWVVVFGHRPMYLSAAGEICTNCTKAFEPLFHQYGVDLYMNGHAHVYEREAPIYKNVTDPAELNNPSATWYITNGAAGHYDGLDTLDQPLQAYSRASEDTFYAWSKLIFHNCTHMTHQAISSNDSAVFDEATLFKNRTCAAYRAYPHPHSHHGKPTGSYGGYRPSFSVPTGTQTW